MNVQALIPDFLALCHQVHAKGLTSSSGGNISQRCGDQILITPSGRSLQLLKPEDVVLMKLDGSYRSENGGIPSKEWRMHLCCYTREDVNTVIHVHSPNATAISCLENADPQCAIPVYTPGFGVRVGRLPMLPYLVNGSAELADAVAKVIEYRDSVLLANHGPLAVGATAEAALNIIEELEEEARLYFILGGKGRTLTPEQQADLYPMGLRRTPKQ